MIHEFIFNDASYEVDDEKLFDNQNKEFKQLWQSIDKEVESGYSMYNSETETIIVYNRGGVVFMKKESEVDNDI